MLTTNNIVALRLLEKFTLNTRSTGATLIANTPNVFGLYHVLFALVEYDNGYNADIQDPVLSIGTNASSYDDIVDPTTFDPVSGTVQRIDPASGKEMAHVPPNTPVYVNVQTASQGSGGNGNVHVFVFGVSM